MSAVMHPNLQVYHGPNTLENFHNFSIECVISELQSHAPDVFQPLKSLGTLSNQENEEGPTAQNLRVVTALVSLLKSRSVRILGVQLLITFTLIARATSKQVILHIKKVNLTVIIGSPIIVGYFDLKSCWSLCVTLDCMEVLTATDGRSQISRNCT